MSCQISGAIKGSFLVKQAGQIVVFRFPETDLEEGKLRSVLLLGRLPGEYDDGRFLLVQSVKFPLND
jgi:mRNA interferase MazF